MDSEDIYDVVAELPMENYVYEDMEANISRENIVSHGSICNNSVGANIIPRTKSRVIRDSPRDWKIMIGVIIVIMLLLSATCAGTVYTLLQVFRLQSEQYSISRITTAETQHNECFP